MTNLANLAPSQTYGDLLTIPNNNQGLNLVLSSVQDGLGNNSPMSLALNAVNFDRTGGQTFRIDNTAITAQPVDINSMCSPNPVALGVGSLTVPSGTTGQQPLPVNGMIRYNTTDNRFEVVQNGVWIALTNGTGVFSGGVSTNNALVRWNGGLGTLVSNSPAILTNTGDLSGLLSVEAGNIAIDGNTISSFNVNGNIDITPNGVGSVFCNSSFTVRGDFLLARGLAFIEFELPAGPFANQLYTLPTAMPIADGYVLSSTAAGQWSWINTGNFFGPNASTPNALVRFADGSGKVGKDSGVTLSDAGSLQGLTQLICGNLTIGGNVIAALNVNGPIVLAPNGNGRVSCNSSLAINNSISIGGGGSTIIFEVPAGPFNNQLYTLPTTFPPGPGYFLTSDTFGNLSWAIPA